MGAIVVGVDGSEASVAALEFAVEEATRRHGSLRVVTAWEAPTPPQAATHAAVDNWEGKLSAAQGAAEAIVAEALARAQQLRPEIEYERVVREGEAFEVLEDEAQEAAVIIVGRRGHGALGGHRLLGSVSQHVADCSPCPVIVVPHHAEA